MTLREKLIRDGVLLPAAEAERLAAARVGEGLPFLPLDAVGARAAHRAKNINRGKEVAHQ